MDNFRAKRLSKEIESVANSKEIKESSDLHGVIILPDIDLKPIIKSMDIISDYVNNFTDHITIDVLLPLSDFIHYVYPNREEIQFKIRRSYIGSSFIFTYKAILDTELDRPIEQYSNVSDDATTTATIDVKFQLVDDNVINATTKLINGVYRKDTLDDIIRVNIYDAINFKNSDFTTLSEVIIAPIDNKRIYNHIIVPIMQALKVPGYIQDRYGLYNGSVGVFKSSMDTPNTFIYPKFNVRLQPFYDSTELHVLAVPNKSIRLANTTYAFDGNILKVIVNNQSLQRDDDANTMSNGTQILAIESDSILKRPFKVSKDGIEIKSEHTVRKIKPNSNTTKIKYVGHTNNMYKHRSDVLQDDGILTQVVWDRSNSRYIYPMMPLVYIDEVNGTVGHRKGVVVQKHVIIDKTHKTERTILTLFLERNTDKTTNVNIF